MAERYLPRRDARLVPEGRDRGCELRHDARRLLPRRHALDPRHRLRNLRRAQGPQGLQGETGPAGVSRVIVNVTNTTGVPAANAALDNGVLTITLSGIKGETGNTGSSVDFPFELVDNCIDGGRNKALSAEQGKILNQKIDEKFVFLTEQQFEELSSYDATKIYCTYES